MESPGTYLKRERELRGVSLDAMHEAVRVPKRYLAALEADDYSSLPHPTFVKGFIKTYCKHLGVDETDAVLRFEMYMRELSDKAAPSAPSAAKPEAQWRPAVPSNLIVYLAAAGVAVVIIAYAVLSRRDGAPAPRAREAAEAPAQPAAQAPAPTAQAPDAVRPAAVGPQPDHPRPEMAPLRAAQPKEAARAAGKEPIARPAVQPVGKDAVQAPAAAARARDDGYRHTLVMTASDTVWVKVRIDGDEPFDVTLRKDEKAVWKAREVISVLVGNAGGVEASFDDERLPPLGARGEVVNFVLPRGAAPSKGNDAGGADAAR